MEGGVEALDARLAAGALERLFGEDGCGVRGGAQLVICSRLRARLARCLRRGGGVELQLAVVRRVEARGRSRVWGPDSAPP